MSFLFNLFNQFTQGKSPDEIQNEQLEALKKLRYEDVDEYKFSGQNFWGKCVKVYDGDTLHCAFFIEDKPYRFRVRFSGIDTAELRSKDQDPNIREQEVKHAEKARDRLIELIGDDLIYLRCEEKQDDKYQRILAKVYKDDKSLVSFNEQLVAEGLAYEYDGGTRRTFREWALGVVDGTKNPTDDNIQDSEVL